MHESLKQAEESRLNEFFLPIRPAVVDRASRQPRRRNLILQRPIFSRNLFQQRRAPGHRTSVLPMRYLDPASNGERADLPLSPPALRDRPTDSAAFIFAASPDTSTWNVK